MLNTPSENTKKRLLKVKYKHTANLVCATRGIFMDVSIDNLIQALQMLKASGVPGSAIVKKGAAALQRAPIGLDNGSAANYNADTDSWSFSPGPLEAVTVVSFP